MIKRLVLILIGIISISASAQVGGTASPYSFYGIGSLKFKGTVENRSMGGLSIYNDSIHVNLRNPSSYVGPNLEILNYRGESRPVKFTVAGGYNNLNLDAQSGSEDASTATFDYLALSFPAGRFGFGFGLLPYTSVGYQLDFEDSADQDENLDNRYSGEGGLNRAFFGAAYRISNNFSFGVDMSYNFGNIQNNALAFLYDEDGDLLDLQTSEFNRSDLSGLTFNFGLNYQTMITEKLQLTSSATYAPSSNLSSENERTFSTININNPNLVPTTIDVDLAGQGLKNTDLTLPSRFSVGAGLGKPRNWFLGAEYTRQNTSEFSNPIFDAENSNFVDANGFILGGYFIPDYTSFSSYWKRVTYRAGFHAENTGLNINGEDINEFGISFGVGLPVGGNLSNVNLGVEFGQRGTTDQNLIQENFVNFRISLSLNDRWFEKLKYK